MSSVVAAAAFRDRPAGGIVQTGAVRAPAPAPPALSLASVDARRASAPAAGPPGAIRTRPHCMAGR